MKQENFQTLIEREIFKGTLYGFARLNLPHISEVRHAEIESGNCRLPIND